jgi:hypothetical protein
LSTCLSYDLSPRAFLEKYLITTPVLQVIKILISARVGHESATILPLVGHESALDIVHFSKK